jgi:ABC-2 type transport system ATP-binding protein
MRGELTAALLHDPELVVLDQPTIGLDLARKERLRTFLAGVNAERGVTLLLTTHDLPDVERLCRRLVVIDQGGCSWAASSTRCGGGSAARVNWWWS